MHWSIYKITNIVNQKIYIGITKNSHEIRWKTHVHTKKGSLLNKSIRKYGKENFVMEEIDSAETLKEASQKEMSYIQKYDSWYKNGKGYNVVVDYILPLTVKERKENKIS